MEEKLIEKKNRVCKRDTNFYNDENVLIIKWFPTYLLFDDMNNHIKSSWVYWNPETHIDIFVTKVNSKLGLGLDFRQAPQILHI